MDRKILLGIIVVLVVVAVLFVLSTNNAAPAKTTEGAKAPVTEKPVLLQGPASDAVIFKKVAPENASAALLSGEIDYYLTSLTPEQAVALKDNPNVELYYATSQFNGLVLNPAPAKAGELNPFSIQKVRLALQYLVDRQGIVDSVNKGFGTPIVIDLVPEHPSYAFFKDAVDDFGITHDTAKAEGMITEAMTAAGASKVGGLWSYNGKPVEIKFLILTYNSDINGVGEAVASELESVGFKVNRTYLARGDDSPSEFSDPAELKWNIEASGWIFYGVSKYEGVGFLELYSKEGWWEYNNSAIKAVNDRLKNISSEEEWKQLNNQLVGLYLNDSVGIWVTAKNNVFAARSSVQGLTNDKFVGLRSYGNVREAYVPGKTTLVIGAENLHDLADGWNPVSVESINMMDIVNTMQDPAQWANPKTLEIEAFRAAYTIETNPTAAIEVPQDAFTWNHTTNQWVDVGQGAKAKSKVTYDLSKYIGAKWHDGSVITWADVLYGLANRWDMAYDADKKKIFDNSWNEIADTIKGLEISGNNLEVYLDFWSFDDDSLLVFGSLFQRLTPWELYAAMDKLVFSEGKFFYSRYDAPEGSTVPPLDLTNSSHVQAVLDSLDSMEFSKGVSFVTAGGKAYLTEADFAARKAALKAWANQYGHLLISDGPFYLVKYDRGDGSVELKAFRDPTYPFKKGDRLV